MSRASLLVLVLLLAGCSGGGADRTAGDVTPAQELYVEGVVVSEGIVPIANASVTLSPGDLTALTDTSGMFRMGPVDEGTYTLRVTVDGYADGTTQVIVSAAGTEAARLVMAAVRDDVPYIDVISFEGYHDCTFDFYVDGLGSQTLPCGIVDCVTGQDVSTDIWQFPFEISSPGLAGIVVELFFPAQPAGSQMGLHMRSVTEAGGCVDAGGTNLDVQYASARGPSPLRMWVVQGIENPGADDGAAFHVPQNESRLYQLMTVGRADYDAQADVHLRLQSRQQIFVTMFYHQLGDPSYTVDGG